MATKTTKKPTTNKLSRATFQTSSTKKSIVKEDKPTNVLKEKSVREVTSSKKATSYANSKNLLTVDGIRDLEEELKKLIEIERPQVIAEIREAREQGDLSENAEFDAAREKQGMIEDRIKEIENIIANSEVLLNDDASLTVKKVRVGSVVTLKDLKTKKVDKYIIVGSLEANPFENKISNVSPLAQAILNAKENEIVTVDTNDKYDVQVLSID